MENTSLSLVTKFPKDKFALLIPIETVAKIPEIQSPVINAVKISTNLDDKEIYLQDKTNKLYALTKRGLTKLAEAAGIKQIESKPVLPSTCQKCAEVNQSLGKFVPCSQCKNRDIKYHVKISVPQLTGETLYFEDHHEIRVEEATQGMSDRQKQEFLKHLPQICEAKALNGAIRTALQIKGTYTLQELEKPFVVAYLVPNLDNADVKRAAIESMFASSERLFGKSVMSKNIVEAKHQEDSGYKDVIEHEETSKEVSEKKQSPTQYEDNAERPDEYCCDKCGEVIPKRVWEYSMEHDGYPLCMKCQKKFRNEQRGANR